jgi:hypothetical protein
MSRSVSVYVAVVNNIRQPARAERESVDVIGSMHGEIDPPSAT